MRLRLVVWTMGMLGMGPCLFASAGCSSGGDDDDPIDVDAGVDSGTGLPDPEAGRLIFDDSVLHEIVIEIDPSNVGQLNTDRVNRTPCTFTFDGVTLHDVGIKQKGQGTSLGTLLGKPSFNVKFDAFIEGQELDGIDKLVFQNAAYDPTLMNEALGYDLYREFGVPAPRSSHGVITILGLPGGPLTYGVHVIVEGVAKNFLRLNFGRENGNGNLYEDNSGGDFGSGPLNVELKDEAEEGRTREHLVELSNILNQAPANELLDRLAPILDIDAAVKGWAIDTLAGHWDGFWFATHNYYIYDNPADGRFVLMPHGMDLLFHAVGFGSNTCRSFSNATSVLGRRFLETPGVPAMAEAATTELLEGPWDPVVMYTKVQNLTALLDASEHDEPAFLVDREAHHRAIPRLLQVFEAFDKPEEGGGGLGIGPACGNGVLERAQACQGMCDDGNIDSGDGCSAACAMEECGDGVVQPDLGEICETLEEGCNDSCSGFIVCGDGRAEGFIETCDDGNAEPGDGCSETCELEFCGDGRVQDALGEVCDGENLCRADCSGFIACGDGNIEFPEYCDDGNQVDEDTCTNDCESRCVTIAHGPNTFDLCLAGTSYTLSTPICSHIGSRQATPGTLDQDAWLREQTQALLPGVAWWLGVVDEGAGWRAANGTPLQIEAWAPGEPSGAGTCAALTPEGWVATSCDEPHPVVCVR
jgi:spore coat protein H